MGAAAYYIKNVLSKHYPRTIDILSTACYPESPYLFQQLIFIFGHCPVLCTYVS
jgi:hypothetical protein